MLTLASFGNRDSTQRLSLKARLLSGTKSLSGWSSDLMFMKPSVHRALINNASAMVVQGFVETQVATFAVPAAMPWSTACRGALERRRLFLRGGFVVDLVGVCHVCYPWFLKRLSRAGELLFVGRGTCCEAVCVLVLAEITISIIEIEVCGQSCSVYSVTYRLRVARARDR